MENTLWNRLEFLAESQPDKLAVAFKKERLTWRELLGKASGMAEFLCQQGVKQGDRVCYSAVSKPEMAATFLAIEALGAVSVFLDKNSTPQNMADIYHSADAALLLTDKPMKEWGDGCRIHSLRHAYEEAAKTGWEAVPVQEDDLAEILFTTGTTGKPKGVMLSYRSVYHILMNTIEGIGIRPDDVVLLPLPLNHSFALRVFRAVLWQGAAIVLQNGFTFAKAAEDNITEFHCTGMGCVPASYEVMKSQMQDKFAETIGKLRFIEFSAGSLTVRQRRELTECLPNTVVYNTWGSSESGGAIFCNVTEAVRSAETEAALGKPLAGKVQVRILDRDGREIDSDAAHPGRMALKGDMQMVGYWGDPEQTARTLADGWLLTGDLAYLQNGYVYMLGRADDIINVGGEKVSPIEVENIAGQFPAMRECACIGAEDPDGILGQIPVLFVVTDAGYEEDALQRFLAERMERYKLPKRYVSLEAIPRNRMKKIDRRQLRRIWEDQDSLELMNPVMQTILARHSVRKFTEQEIPGRILDMILRAGYHAPSGHNMQSWRFTVLEKTETIARLRRVAEETAKEKGVYFYGWENPQVLILISNDERNAYGCQDASCAAENMILAAGSYGLGTVWLNPLMTLRHAEPVASLLTELGVPENHTVWCTLALGYPAAQGAALAKKRDVIIYADRK